MNVKLEKMINSQYEIKPSVYEAKDNLIIFFDKLKNNIIKNRYKNILVISHGGILQLVQKMLCNIDLKN